MMIADTYLLDVKIVLHPTNVPIAHGKNILLLEFSARLVLHHRYEVHSSSRTSYLLTHLNFLRTSKVTAELPINVAVLLSRKLSMTPERRPGANDLVGFIDAPEMKARKKILRPTMPLITRPPKPRRPWYGLPNNGCVINRAVAKTSIPKTNGEDRNSQVHLPLMTPLYRLESSRIDLLKRTCNLGCQIVR